MPTYQVIFQKDGIRLIESLTAKDIVEAFKVAVEIAKAQGWTLVMISFVSK